jgi:hypothetical protein
MDTEIYDSLDQAIRILRTQGYTEDFNLKEDCLECEVREINLFPEEFHIEKVFRFYGASDPDDESILYAISSEKYQLKGILVNGYGVSSDLLTQEMVNKLK